MNNVQKFTYPGIVLTEYAQYDIEVRTSIGLANEILQNLSKVLRNGRKKA